MNKKDSLREICDSCGLNKNELLLYKHVASDNYYCEECVIMGFRMREIGAKVNHKEVNDMTKHLFPKKNKWIPNKYKK
ncbi:MAG: hypothetical protein mread185_000438 [Mycoplasmataceae bacterium]|nr:MAG: hypothetical protein mread185_000438 [Mycoplasmataceae bacterium]